MPDEPSPAQRMIGDVWERPVLSKRDRSLITVAALVALYRTRELPSICAARWTTA